MVVGADVRIINQDTGAVARSIKTDANGSFTAALLPVGTYTVSVSSSGFQEASITGVVVRITEITRMEARLRPVAVQQKIEVQATIQAVDTSTATTGQAIEANTIRSLPLATQQVVTAVELLSPTNKRPGSEGREHYLAKRQSILSHVTM